MNTKVIDMHCDTITALTDKNLDLLENDFHISLNKLLQGNYAMQCFAIFLYLQDNPKPFEKAKMYIEAYQKFMNKYSDIISPVYNYDQLINNIKNDKLSALLTTEEGEIIEGNLDNVDYLYSQGVRMMTITWNFKNQLGHPNILTKEKFEPDTKNGLTDLGFDFVRKCNEKGIIVDIAHLSDKGIYDVLNTTTKPIVASHSNSRTICNVPRNLTDDMIIKLADSGSLLGINYCPDFISKDTSVNQIPMIVEHIKHITNIGGIGVCGLGSDFDGIPTPNGMSDATKTKDLYQALVDAHFSSSDIDKIFYQNFLRVFKDNCSL